MLSRNLGRFCYLEQTFVRMILEYCFYPSYGCSNFQQFEFLIDLFPFHLGDRRFTVLECLQLNSVCYLYFLNFGYLCTAVYSDLPFVSFVLERFGLFKLFDN
jgi:hypothetical protein